MDPSLSMSFYHAQVLVRFDQELSVIEMILSFLKDHGQKCTVDHHQQLKDKVDLLCKMKTWTYNDVMYKAQKGELDSLQTQQVSPTPTSNDNISSMNLKSPLPMPQLQPGLYPPMFGVPPSHASPPLSMWSGNSGSKSSVEFIYVRDPFNSGNMLRLSMKWYSDLPYNIIRSNVLEKFTYGCPMEKCNMRLLTPHLDPTGNEQTFFAYQSTKLSWSQLGTDELQAPELFYSVDNLDDVAVLLGGALPRRLLRTPERATSAAPVAPGWHGLGPSYSFYDPAASHTGGRPPQYADQGIGYNAQPVVSQSVPPIYHPQPQVPIPVQQTQDGVEARFRPPQMKFAPPTNVPGPHQTQQAPNNPSQLVNPAQNEQSTSLVSVEWSYCGSIADVYLDLNAPVSHFEAVMNGILKDFKMNENLNLYKLKFEASHSENEKSSLRIVDLRNMVAATAWPKVVNFLMEKKNLGYEEPFKCDIEAP